MAKSNSTPAYYIGSRTRYENNAEQRRKRQEAGRRQTSGYNLVPTQGGTAWTTPGAANATTPAVTPVTESLVSEIPEISAWDTSQYSMSEPPKQSPAHEELMAAISADPLYNQYVEMGLNTVQPYDLTAQANTKYLTPEATQAYYAVLGRDGAAAAADFLDVLDAYTEIEQQRIAYDQQERERLARIAEQERYRNALTKEEEERLIALRDGLPVSADGATYEELRERALTYGYQDNAFGDKLGRAFRMLPEWGSPNATDYINYGLETAGISVLSGLEKASEFVVGLPLKGIAALGDLVGINTDGMQNALDETLANDYFGGILDERMQQYGAGGVLDDAGNIVRTIGEMVPAMGVSLLMGNPTAASSALSGTVGLAPATASLLTSAATAGGGAYQQAKADGATDLEAAAYAFSNAALAGVVEKAFAGIPLFNETGAADDIVQKVTSSLTKNQQMRELMAQSAQILGEGFEEYAEAAIEPYLQTIYSETQRGKSFAEIWDENQEERMQSALYGALVSLFLNAGQAAVNRITSGGNTTVQPEIDPEVAEIDAAMREVTASQPQAQIAQNGTGLTDVLPQQSANIPAAQQTALQGDTEAIGNEAVNFSIQQRAAELAQGAAQTGVDSVAAIDPATLPADPLAPDSMTPEQFTESRVQAAAEWRAEQEPEHQELVQREQEAVRQQEAQRAAFSQLKPETRALVERTPGGAEVAEEAATLRDRAMQIHNSFIAAINSVAESLGAKVNDGGAKSVDSLVNKVLRKHEAGETDYTLYDAKDHVRCAIELPSIADVPAAIQALKNSFPTLSGKAAISAPMNDSGYRGIHLVVDFGDGLKGEIQLTTPEAWQIKLKTDAIYEKWRNVPEESQTAEQTAQRNADYAECRKLWADYYSGFTPEVIAMASDSVMGLASQSGPWTPLNGTQRPSENSTAPERVPSGWANNRPPGLVSNSYSEYSTSSSPFNGSIAQNDGNNNPAPPEVTAGTSEATDIYTELQQKHGTLPHGEIPTRDINVPSRDAQGGKVSLSARTIMESDAPDDFVSALENEVVNGSFSYFESTNKDAIEKAKRRIEQDGAAASLNAWERNFTGEPLKTGASLEERKNALRGVDKEDIALAIELYKSALAAKDYQLAQKLAVEIAAAGNQSGQVVQAMSLIKRMTSDGQLYYLQLVVDRMAKEVQARNPRRKFNISINEGLQQNLLQAKGQEEIDAAVDAIKQNIADQVPATFLDKWNAWRYLSMLGNPKTHIRNTMGNGVMFSVQRIKNGIASGIEAVAQKTGLINERSTTVLGRSKADNALRSFASGDYDVMAEEVAGNKSHDYFSRTTQDIMDRRTVFKSKVFRPVEKARRLNNNLLEAEDKIFSKAHYTRALAQYLKANGWTAEQIQSGTDEANIALQKAREKAIQEAQRATFRDASETAKWLNGASKAADAALAAVMPFTKTPINVLKRGLEYSPVGLIRGIKNSIFDVRSGKVSATEAIDRMAAGLTGSGIVALGWLLGSLGVLTGGDDENDDVQKQKELTGYQNYSLHIGDVYYSLDWLSPISMPLFVGVSLSQSEDIGTALGSLTGPFLEMSMLQGLNSILQSAEYGPFDNKLANMAADAAASYVGQAIPTVFRQLASTIDGTRRDSYAVGDSKGFAKYIEQEANQLGAKIPFVASTGQPYVDAWGRTEENGNFLGRAVENFLSPGYVSRDNTTDVDRFLAELVDEVGDPSLFPNTASRSVTLKQDGDPMEYNADTWTEYSQIRGQAAYDAVNGLIQQPTFMMRLSPEEQAEAIKNAYEMANAIGKSGIDADVSKGWTQNKAVEAYDAGIELSDWILFNTMAEGTSASDRAAALNGMGWLSNDERATMFDIYLPDARYNPFGVAQDLSDRSAVSGSQFLNAYDSLFADGAPTQMDAFNELRSSDLSTVQLAEIWNEIGDMAVSDGGWPSDKNPFMMAYETGINRDDVLDIYGAFYGGRSQSQSRLLEELDDSGFTEAQKAALWEVFAEAQGWKKTWADVS